MIIEQYIRPGKVKLVYRHLQQLGDDSELLSEASECAADQGHFWEMRHALYADQRSLYSDALAGALAAAEEAGANPDDLRTCLDAATHEAAVRADYAAATAEGVRSRPVFKIGDRTLIGQQSFGAFQQLLDQAIGAQ